MGVASCENGRGFDGGLGAPRTPTPSAPGTPSIATRVLDVGKCVAYSRTLTYPNVRQQARRVHG